MKITRSQLKQIIKEELESMEEGFFSKKKPKPEGEEKGEESGQSLASQLIGAAGDFFKKVFRSDDKETAVFLDTVAKQAGLSLENAVKVLKPPPRPDWLQQKIRQAQLGEEKQNENHKGR